MNLRTLLAIAAMRSRTDYELCMSTERVQKTPKSKEQQERDIEKAKLKRQEKNLKRLRK